MNSTQPGLDWAIRSDQFRSFDEGSPLVPGDADHSIAVLNCDGRECERLARRVHEKHPDVPLARISALVAQATDELADSRVQSFKMILVERAVLRRLTVRP